MNARCRKLVVLAMLLGCIAVTVQFSAASVLAQTETPTPTPEVLVTATPTPSPTPDPFVALQARADEQLELNIYGMVVIGGLLLGIFVVKR